MNLHLPIDEVDKFVEIAVSTRLDWQVSRRQYTRPEKIVYSLKRKGEEKSSYAVKLYPLDRTHTKIEFPVPVKESFVVPSQLDVGGTIEITMGSAEVDDSIKETPIYKVCDAIWVTVKLQEYLRTEDIDNMEMKGIYLPLKPPIGASMHQWFDYQLTCEKTGFKYTLAQMAVDSGYSEGSLKNSHSNWKREKGL